MIQGAGYREKAMLEQTVCE